MKEKEVLTEAVKTLVEALLIVAIILSVAYAATGMWRIGFAIESGSMEPNMMIGDLILVQAPQRTNIITYEQGKSLDIDYKSFNHYGDVIIYQPNGFSSTTPIIHRAMKWIEKGDRMPNGKPAPHDGYLTKGDNNQFFDQQSLYTDSQLVEPVKPEWIIAVAKVRIPYLGYPSIKLKPLLVTLKPIFAF
jgi:signal peptidase